eukprot:TRINITY_DN5905_c0_g1_i1.p1 TRINITY_DN5905_c0_g1~~TRINITY_DN5905_c0_g1_i1.p1  ORF type:complete len:654 (-),score=116.19 TRINITY_DN5905_c0_g1_i1:89-2050(-)
MGRDCNGTNVETECPLGHVLTKHDLLEETWCDLCSNAILPDEEYCLHCEPCDFIQCQVCSGRSKRGAEEPMDTSGCSSPFQGESLDDLLRRIGEELPFDVAKKAYSSLFRVFCNIAANPREPRFRSLKKSSAALAESICLSSAAVSLLLRMGFEDTDGRFIFPETGDTGSIRLRPYEPLPVQAPPAARKPLFDDHEFRPLPSSLGSDQLAQQVKSWRRASEIYPNGSFFGDTTIVQGQLSSCWFLAALAGVAGKGAGLFPLVLEESFAEGRYTFCFHKTELEQESGWVHVTIDDWLPADEDGLPIFARAAVPGVLWPSLFEKAYAKLHTSYNALNRGMEVDALSDLTGYSVSLRDLRQPSQNTWNNLLEIWEAGGALGCSLLQSGDAAGEADEFSLEQQSLALQGLGPSASESASRHVLANHTYHVCDLETNTCDGQVLHMQRPIIGSSIGVPKEAFGLDAEDDSFCLTWPDTMKVFSSMSLLHPLPANATALPVQCGTWRVAPDGSAGTAGGCSLNSTWVTNPQWILSLPQPCSVTIILSQEEPRLQGARNNFCPIGLYVVPADTAESARETDHSVVHEDLRIVLQLASPKTPARVAPPELTGFSSNFIASRQVSLNTIRLHGPMTWVVIPCTFEPRVCASFWLRIIVLDLG